MGVCLEFDAAVDPFRQAVKVRYDLEERRGIIGEIKTTLERNLEATRWKSRGWAAEKEWRTVQAFGFRELEYEQSALRKVWLGPRADSLETYILVALMAARVPDTPVGELTKDLTGFASKRTRPCFREIGLSKTYTSDRSAHT
jgi:hypothetical protein